MRRTPFVFVRNFRMNRKCLSRWPGHGASAEQMDVDVIDGLPAVFSGIDHRSIAPSQSFGASNLSGYPVQMSDEGAVLAASMCNGADVLTRNDQHVHRCLRIDIGKGVALVVLVYGLGRDTSLDDPAKEAAHFGFSLHESNRASSEHLSAWLPGGIFALVLFG